MNLEQSVINFCQNLRHLRKVHGMTQKEMAQILGISVKRLSKMDNCDPHVRINTAHLCRVCDYFHLSSDEILFENWPRMLAEKEM